MDPRQKQLLEKLLLVDQTLVGGNTKAGWERMLSDFASEVRGVGAQALSEQERAREGHRLLESALRGETSVPTVAIGKAFAFDIDLIAEGVIPSSVLWVLEKKGRETRGEIYSSIPEARDQKPDEQRPPYAESDSAPARQDQKPGKQKTEDGNLGVSESVGQESADQTVGIPSVRRPLGRYYQPPQEETPTSGGQEREDGDNKKIGGLNEEIYYLALSLRPRGFLSRIFSQITGKTDADVVSQQNTQAFFRALEERAQQDPTFSSSPYFRFLQNLAPSQFLPTNRAISSAKLFSSSEFGGQRDSFPSSGFKFLRFSFDLSRGSTRVGEEILSRGGVGTSRFVSSFGQSLGAGFQNAANWGVSSLGRALGGAFRGLGSFGLRGLGGVGGGLARLGVFLGGGTGVAAAGGGVALLFVGIGVGIFFLIVYNQGSFSPQSAFVPRGGVSINLGSLHIDVGKEVGGPKKYTDPPESIKYKIRVAPKREPLSDVTIVDTITVSGEGKNRTYSGGSWSVDRIADVWDQEYEFKIDDKDYFKDTFVTNSVVVRASVSGQADPVEATFTNTVIVGNPPENCPLGWPTPVGIITQGPNGPFSHRGAQAIDIAAVRATPVTATHSGVVVALQRVYYGYGFHVIIKSACQGDLQTVYAHLSTIVVGGIGSQVGKGDPIGTVDSTGNSTGDHLHYEFIGGLKMGPPYVEPNRNIEGCDGNCRVSW